MKPARLTARWSYTVLSLGVIVGAALVTVNVMFWWPLLVHSWRYWFGS